MDLALLTFVLAISLFGVTIGLVGIARHLGRIASSLESIERRQSLKPTEGSWTRSRS